MKYLVVPMFIIMVIAMGLGAAKVITQPQALTGFVVPLAVLVIKFFIDASNR